MVGATGPTLEQLQALLESPAGKPPSGVIPNLTDPPNLRRPGRIVLLLSLLIATLAFAMRIYTKARIMRRLHAADYSLAVGWGLFAGFCVPLWLLNSLAGGVHQWNIYLKDYSTFSYYIRIGNIMYGFCIFFIKLSILLQYIQIFVPLKSRNALYWSAWTLISINLVFYLTCIFLEIFACSPVAKAWNPLIQDGHCIHIIALEIAASTVNSASDIAILILHQVSIWRLQLSLKRKVQISSLFFIGVLLVHILNVLGYLLTIDSACASSIVRLFYSIKVFFATDLTYIIWFAGIWTLPEMASGIIVACLPVAPRFIEKLKGLTVFSKAASSLRSLLGHGLSVSEKVTKQTSIKHFTNDGMAYRNNPKHYETLPDGPPLTMNSTEANTSDLEKSVNNQGETYIMRTMEFDAHSDPRQSE